MPSASNGWTSTHADALRHIAWQTVAEAISAPASWVNLLAPHLTGRVLMSRSFEEIDASLHALDLPVPSADLVAENFASFAKSGMFVVATGNGQVRVCFRSDEAVDTLRHAWYDEVYRMDGARFAGVETLLDLEGAERRKTIASGAYYTEPDRPRLSPLRVRGRAFPREHLLSPRDVYPARPERRR